jgi:nicotinate-nucleotide adenylyltransferase
MTRPCVALLGGSFDPVHNGHVALASYFSTLLAPDELRILPAGNPWQKPPLSAASADRIEMIRLAFATLPVPVAIDTQEILREGPSYTLDTLRTTRAELGERSSIVFLLGADQLHKLNTWFEWQRLFDYAHVCAASRPGFSLEDSGFPAPVAREFKRRAATPDQIRTASHGLTYLASNLAIDISSSQIRSAFKRGDRPAQQIPLRVLDYIEQHHLYQS